MFCVRYDVYKITEYRDGCIYRTKKLTTIWVACTPHTTEQEKAIAAKHGGDILAATTECKSLQDGYEL